MVHEKRDKSGRSVEKYCIECLKGYLGKRAPDESLRSGPGADPPDFYLFVGEREFAVEVTSLVEYLSGPGKRLSHLYYSHRLHELAERIEKEAGRRGVLQGIYALKALGNPALPAGGEEKAFIDTCVGHLQDAARWRIGGERTVWTDKCSRGANLSLWRVSHSAAAVEPAESGGGWGAEITRELQDLLRDCLSRKRRRIEKAGAPERCADIILVLYSVHRLAAFDDFQACVGQISEIQWFHSVFLVSDFIWARPHREVPGWFLHTKEAAWQEEPAQQA